jgi:hypothetical protein
MPYYSTKIVFIGVLLSNVIIKKPIRLRNFLNGLVKYLAINFFIQLLFQKA